MAQRRGRSCLRRRGRMRVDFDNRSVLACAGEVRYCFTGDGIMQGLGTCRVQFAGLLIGLSVVLGLPMLASGQDQPAAKAAKQRVYFGTYTRGTKSEGIYVADLDVTAGKIANV